MNFSETHNIDANIVKDYLLDVIENKREQNKKFEEEYNEVKDILSSDDEER